MENIIFSVKRPQNTKYVFHVVLGSFLIETKTRRHLTAFKSTITAQADDPFGEIDRRPDPSPHYMSPLKNAGPETLAVAPYLEAQPTPEGDRAAAFGVGSWAPVQTPAAAPGLEPPAAASGLEPLQSPTLDEDDHSLPLQPPAQMTTQQPKPDPFEGLAW